MKRKYGFLFSLILLLMVPTTAYAQLKRRDRRNSNGPEWLSQWSGGLALCRHLPN